VRHLKIENISKMKKVYIVIIVLLTLLCGLLYMFGFTQRIEAEKQYEEASMQSRRAVEIQYELELCKKELSETKRELENSR
jgi:flagellar basal body-associated protein FliL